ncbi:hypothetical protein JZ751_005434 [Albula glossodonta]|uniref:Uncharacterized protein n=1 Tax=Albula glossodonta TaxID=121402 RepID=A0A8T2MN16_9TELE|nr:hypothetical protein JZ751_005434 [Albula glossodonta]
MLRLCVLTLIGGCGVTECKRLSFTFSDTPQPARSPCPPWLVPPLHHGHASGERQPIPAVQSTEEGGRRREDEGEEEDEEDDEEEEGSISISLASGPGRMGGTGGGLDNCSASLGSGRLSGSDIFPDPAASDTMLRDEGSELKPVELDGEGGNLTKQLVRRLTSADALPDPARPEGALGWGSSLEEAFHGLLLTLEGLQEKSAEVQELEQECARLEEAPVHRSRSSSLSLTVESALESFDFLNTSDFDDNDTGDDDLSRSGFYDLEAERTGASQHPEARGHLSEALTEDTGVGNSVAGTPCPSPRGAKVSTSPSPDTCNTAASSYRGSPSSARALLQKLCTQTQLLEELGDICADRQGSIDTPSDGKYPRPPQTDHSIS